MTTTTTTANDTTQNIIKALPRWKKASIKINGIPYGWVPLHCLGLSVDDIYDACEANVIDVREVDIVSMNTTDGDIHIGLSTAGKQQQVIFIEDEVSSIRKMLQ